MIKELYGNYEHLGVVSGRKQSPVFLRSEASAWRHYARHKGTGNAVEVACEEYLLDCHKKLALYVANKVAFAGRRVGALDADLQAGATVGLLKAIRTYDQKRGIKFSTHAFWQIRHEAGLEVRVARFFKESASADCIKLEELAAKFYNAYHRDIDVDEVMSITGWGYERSRSRLAMVDQQVASFSSIVSVRPKGRSGIGLTASISEADLTYAYAEEDMSRQSWPPEMLIDGLVLPDCFDPESLSAIRSDLQRAIFSAFFLEQKHGDLLPTLESVSQQFGVTRERIRQAINSSVQAVRAYHVRQGANITATGSSLRGQRTRTVASPRKALAEAV